MTIGIVTRGRCAAREETVRAMLDEVIAWVVVLQMFRASADGKDLNCGTDPSRNNSLCDYVLLGL